MLGRASGIKKPSFDGFLKMAVGQGFEPREPLGSTVFKTAAFDHSAISPISYNFKILYYTVYFNNKNLSLCVQ